MQQKEKIKQEILQEIKVIITNVEALKMPAKKTAADKKYANGTTYKDSKGKVHKRTSAKGTKRGDAYCARSSGQKSKDGTMSPKLKARRKAWGCKGKKSVRSK